jgi:glycosyltransferase involved in cell wall biosynthesis
VWNGKSVSLIFPTYNEKDSIRAAVEEFASTGILDEIIVVNNNAAAGTSEEISGTLAREVFEGTQGYGAAIRCGFRESVGDLVIVAEPDGTFRGRDIRKILAYAEDFEVVYGSRTVKELIWEGANMGLFLKWGNYAVAKLMEFLFNTTALTDVGCTMRCIHRETLREIEPFFTVNGSFFGPEMMVISILKKKSMIQIPVNYTKRIGTSSVTGSLLVALHLGLQMIGLILRYRLMSWKNPQLFEAPDRLPTLDIFSEEEELEKEKDSPGQPRVR